jgi:hypothetical protein
MHREAISMEQLVGVYVVRFLFALPDLAMQINLLTIRVNDKRIDPDTCDFMRPFALIGTLV